MSANEKPQAMPLGWAVFCLVFLLGSMICSVVWINIPIHINLLASISVTLAARVIRLESPAELYAASALLQLRRSLAAGRFDGLHAYNLRSAAVNRGPVLRRIKISHYEKSELHHCETS